MKYLFVILILSPLFVIGQVEIDKPIVFSSSNESERRVIDIETTTNVDLLSSKEVIENQFQYASTSISNDTLYASFDPSFDELLIGLKLFIKTPSISIPAINYIKIDKIPAVRIYIHFNQDIQEKTIKNDEIINIVFDGLAFQTLKRKQSTSCPNGFVEINQTYCITQYRQGPGVFKDNVAYCSSLGARLCSWAEWVYACENYSAQITDMSIAGNEWINTGGNGANSAKVVGNNSCRAHGFTSIQTGVYYYRCCYNRK